MATDADARAAGFATPAGTELISGGDDAIRQNARAAVDLHALATRWQATPLSAGDVTAQPLGAYTIADPATVTGLPAGAAAGVLERQEGLDQYVTAEPAATLWERQKIGGLWHPWAIARREIVTPYALTRPQATLTETVPSRSVRIPFSVPAEVRRWRVVIRNINHRTNTLYPGQVTLNSVNVGGQARDANGNRTSSFAPVDGFPSGLRILAAGVTVADMSTGWSSGWSTVPLHPGTDYLLSFGYLTNGQDVQLSMGAGWQTSGNPGNARLTNDATAATAARQPFDVRLELITSDETPTEVIIGDSISAGSNATFPVLEAPARTAAGTQRLTRLHTFGGAALGEWIGANWGSAASIKWQEITTAGRAARAVIALGSNDIHAGTDLTTLQANYRALIALLRERVTSEVVACTVTPRTAWTGTAKETLREAFNDWLRALPEGITAVADTARAVEDGTGHSPRADMVTADGIHFNSSGSAALAGALASPRATPPDPSARLAALEYDSGWRNISTLLEPGIGGNVFISREGKTVHMMFHNVTTTTAGTVDIYQLPPGFRPTAVSGANWRNGTLSTDNGDTVRQASYFNNRMRILNMPTGKQLGGYLIFRVPPALPTTIPGTPA